MLQFTQYTSNIIGFTITWSHIQINTCTGLKIRGIITVLKLHIDTLYILFGHQHKPVYSYA